MRLCLVSHLVAHSWAKLKLASIRELRFELPGETQQNVPLLAPVIGAIVG